MDLAALRHVAALAELSLTDEEQAKFASEVGRILAYVDELEAVDTTDVPTSAHAGLVGAPVKSGDSWRRDEVVPGLSQDEALAQAPRPEHGGFGVPGFVE